MVPPRWGADQNALRGWGPTRAYRGLFPDADCVHPMDPVDDTYKKTMCAAVPQRTRTTSRMVCALGARRLISTAMMPNSMICRTAPAAYQKGPRTCSRGGFST